MAGGATERGRTGAGRIRVPGLEADVAVKDAGAGTPWLRADTDAAGAATSALIETPCRLRKPANLPALGLMAR